MAAPDFHVRYLSYADIGTVVEEQILCKHHPSRELPVPVEEIIDTKMAIDIFPLPGLTRALAGDESDGIVAFVNSALNCITVDDDAWRSKTPRYRFSIAHELAHIVMHQGILRRFAYDSVAGWQEAMKVIPTKEYGWLEWQANAFAGHLLVPTAELRIHHQDCMGRMQGFSIDSHDEGVRLLVEKHLAGIFRASSQVIHIRIEKEQLWP